MVRLPFVIVSCVLVRRAVFENLPRACACLAGIAHDVHPFTGNVLPYRFRDGWFVAGFPNARPAILCIL